MSGIKWPNAITWPKLSESLTGERSPDRCQSCGRSSDGLSIFDVPGLTRWREHDDGDRPTTTFVILCDLCQKRLIEKHPRLYSELEVNRPWPGTMSICLDCKHRVGTTCPIAGINAGPGVVITGPRASTMHVCSRPGGCRTITRYPGPATACDRREEGDAP